MSEASFEHILKSVAPLTDQIYFHVMGEPLLHPKIERFLALCNDYQLKVNITTNGVLIQSVQDVLLRAPALKQVNFSLSSYEANRQILSLESYIGHITDYILKAQAETESVSSLRLWNLDGDVTKGANRWNDEIMALLERNLKLDFSIKEKCNAYRQGKLSNDVYINLAQKFDWPDIALTDTVENVFCYGLRDQIGILVDGTVVPCCLDSDGNIPLGNVFETDLQQIVDSKRAVAIHTGFTNRQVVEELCKKCGFARKF